MDTIIFRFHVKLGEGTDSGMTGGFGIGNNHCWIYLKDGCFQDLDTWFTTMVILNPQVAGVVGALPKDPNGFQMGVTK